MPINFFINTRFVLFNNKYCMFPVLFSVRSPFILRSSSVHPPLILRSGSVRAPFELRSGSVRAPFKLRSGSVRESKIDRRLIEDWSKNERRIIGGKTEKYRNSNGKPRERRPEQELYFLSLNSNYYGKTYSKLHHFSAPSHSAYWKSMSNVKGALTKSGEEVISGKQ